MVRATIPFRYTETMLLLIFSGVEQESENRAGFFALLAHILNPLLFEVLQCGFAVDETS